MGFARLGDRDEPWVEGDATWSPLGPPPAELMLGRPGALLILEPLESVIPAVAIVAPFHGVLAMFPGEFSPF